MSDREGTPEELAAMLGEARDAQQEPTPGDEQRGEEQQQDDTTFSPFGSKEPSELVKAMHPPTEQDQQKAEPEPEREQLKDDPSGSASTPTPTDADRTEAAKLLGIHPDLAPLLKGETVEELVSDAASLSKTLDDLRRKEEAKQARHTGFDGGVRETPPAPSDPMAEHNALLLDIFQRQGQGGGGGW